MKRMLLVIAVLAIPSFAMAVEHDVRGITLPDVIKLRDSILSPNVDIVMTWDATLNGWSGTGADGTGYTLEPVGDEGYCPTVATGNVKYFTFFHLFDHPKQNTPLIFEDGLPISGPINTLYGGTGKVRWTFTR